MTTPFKLQYKAVTELVKLCFLPVYGYRQLCQLCDGIQIHGEGLRQCGQENYVDDNHTATIYVYYNTGIRNCTD